MKPAPTVFCPAETACPLCGSDDHSEYAVTDSATYRRCWCGAIFAADVKVVHEDCGYYESLGGYERFLAAKRSEWAVLFKRLAHQAHGRRLLEIGCARGDALALSREYGWLPAGVEISRDDVDYGRRHHGLNIHHGTIDTCSFPEQSFDLVTMWSVIEHLADPISVLRNCRRLLAPGGLLSIHTPNAESTVALRLGSDWPMLNVPGHLCLFSFDTLLRSVESCKFEILSISTGLGSRPEPLDPELRSRPSLRKTASRALDLLGMKNAVRNAAFALKPELREQGEFLSLLARPALQDKTIIKTKSAAAWIISMRPLCNLLLCANYHSTSASATSPAGLRLRPPCSCSMNI